MASGDGDVHIPAELLSSDVKGDATEEVTYVVTDAAEDAEEAVTSEA